MLAVVNEESEALLIPRLAACVQAMQIGDERALEELYEATVGKLYVIARAVLRNAQDAEEVVCETYAYAWANAARYDAARGNVLAWLLMLCRSRALDRARQRRASMVNRDALQLHSVPAPAADAPDDVLSLMQQHGRVYAALAQLSAERRRLMSMAFLQGLSHQEIAGVTGLPLGTVKSHLRRALAQVRETLEGP